MPELPDITIYIEALEKRILGQTLERVRVVSPFLLRTATPPLGGATGKKVLRLRRVGKRICIGLEGDLRLGAIRCRSTLGKSHAEARPHRPASFQRHRQRLLRRNPVRGKTFASCVYPETRSPGNRSPF